MVYWAISKIYVDHKNDNISDYMKVINHKSLRSICDHFSPATCFRDNSWKSRESYEKLEENRFAARIFRSTTRITDY